MLFSFSFHLILNTQILDTPTHDFGHSSRSYSETTRGQASPLAEQPSPKELARVVAELCLRPGTSCLLISLEGLQGLPHAPLSIEKSENANGACKPTPLCQDISPTGVGG